MNFSNNDLLEFNDLTNVFISDYPSEQADIISKVLSKYCFIHNSLLYERQNNITYRTETKIDIKFKVLQRTNELLEKSFKNLSDTNQKILKLEYPKLCSSFFNLSRIEKYYPILIGKITKTDITFDHTINEIHFNNGYINLLDGSFNERDITKHYISKFIKRDYSQSTLEQKNEILKHIKKIYPIKKDLNCILSILGSALTGLSNNDQETLFLLGSGSSGKSFIMSLTGLSIECYQKELQADIFEKGNNNINKILNSFSTDQQIRISWINELKGSRIDEALFKQFCEGSFQTTKLYMDGTQQINHYSKTICTSNEMPSFKIDSGISRRFRSYEHRSKFTSNSEEVNEQNNIYFKNEKLLNILKEKELLNSWLDIIIEFSISYNKGLKPIWTNNFSETKDIVISSNDVIQDYIDKNLNITNNDKDIINKTNMRSSFLKMYPEKHLSILQIITSFKDKQLKYDSQKQGGDGVRGVFVGVKFKDDFIDEDDEVIISRSNDDIILIQKLQIENNQLKHKLCLDDNLDNKDSEKDILIKKLYAQIEMLKSKDHLELFLEEIKPYELIVSAIKAEDIIEKQEIILPEDIINIQEITDLFADLF
jgi:hypothetical protein